MDQPLDTTEAMVTTSQSATTNTTGDSDAPQLLAASARSVMPDYQYGWKITTTEEYWWLLMENRGRVACTVLYGNISSDASEPIRINPGKRLPFVDNEAAL